MLILGFQRRAESGRPCIDRDAGVCGYLAPAQEPPGEDDRSVHGSLDTKVPCSHSEVEVDDQGISAENLEQILANWPAGEKRPRVV